MVKESRRRRPAKPEGSITVEEQPPEVIELDDMPPDHAPRSSTQRVYYVIDHEHGAAAFRLHLVVANYLLEGTVKLDAALAACGEPVHGIRNDYTQLRIPRVEGFVHEPEYGVAKDACKALGEYFKARWPAEAPTDVSVYVAVAGAGIAFVCSAKDAAAVRLARARCPGFRSLYRVTDDCTTWSLGAEFAAGALVHVYDNIAFIAGAKRKRADEDEADRSVRVKAEPAEETEEPTPAEQGDPQPDSPHTLA